MFAPEIPEAWLGYADRSYISARLLWFTGLQQDSPVHAHRAVELLLKAYLVANGVLVQPTTNAWGHDLQQLWDVCLENDPAMSCQDMTRRVRFFNDYFNYVRYPTSIDDRTNGRLIWFGFDKNVSPLDEVFAYIRPRIKIILNCTGFLEDVVAIESPSPGGFLKRALSDTNQCLSVIIGNEAHDASSVFSSDFDADQPGC